jgi:hypothetical protein
VCEASSVHYRCFFSTLAADDVRRAVPVTLQDRLPPLAPPPPTHTPHTRAHKPTHVITRLQEHQELKEVLSDLNGMSIEKAGEAAFDAKVALAVKVGRRAPAWCTRGLPRQAGSRWCTARTALTTGRWPLVVCAQWRGR